LQAEPGGEHRRSTPEPRSRRSRSRESLAPRAPPEPRGFRGGGLGRVRGRVRKRRRERTRGGRFRARTGGSGGRRGGRPEPDRRRAHDRRGPTSRAAPLPGVRARGAPEGPPGPPARLRHSCTESSSQRHAAAASAHLSGIHTRVGT
jgi:hypothetical protein